MTSFDLIAFDADDTLWHNERGYRESRARFHRLLARYPLHGDIDECVDETEIRNLPVYGYGVTGFALSLVEAAIELTGGRIAAADVQALLDLAKDMLAAPVQLFDQAEETLARLSPAYPLMLVTKGDLLHQRSKVARSGLEGYFRHVEVVSDKTPEVYRAILARHDVPADRFLMVGNSLRSDILPVVAIGGWAVYVPNDLTWSHEHAAPPAEARQRYLEVERLDLVPALIEQLARRASRSPR